MSRDLIRRDLLHRSYVFRNVARFTLAQAGDAYEGTSLFVISRSEPDAAAAGEQRHRQREHGQYRRDQRRLLARVEGDLERRPARPPGEFDLALGELPHLSGYQRSEADLLHLVRRERVDALRHS